MRFLDALKQAPPARSGDELRDFFTFNGQQYGTGVQTTYGQKSSDPISYEFVAYVDQLLKGNGIIASIEHFRLQVLSEARFMFQRLIQGRPGDLWSDARLGLLERPWSGGTTGDLIARLELDAFAAGNSYHTVVGNEIVRLRPDWVQILLAPRITPFGEQLGYRKVGYAHYQDGIHSGNEPTLLPADEVAHYAPIPDPTAEYRGMSWVTAVIRDVLTDGQMTTHKQAFLDHAATPNMIVKSDMPFEKFKKFQELFNEEHQGAHNAYKTLFLGGGADATLVGSSMTEMDFKSVQGAGETRIASPSGIHPVVLGLSEGMQGSSLNAGNYAAAKRKTSDAALRPAWRNMAGSLEILIKPPAASRLWYDDRDVAFLLEDIKDRAAVQQTNAITIRNYVDAGFTPESAKAAVVNEDETLLEHTGLFSVQLQEAGTSPAVPEPARTEVTIAEGAIRTEIHPATVEANTTIERGAVNASSSNNPVEAVESVIEDVVERASEQMALAVGSAFEAQSVRDADRDVRERERDARELERAEQLFETSRRVAESIDAFRVEVARPVRKTVETDATGRIKAVTEEKI